MKTSKVRPPHILIVDDDPDARGFLRIWLEAWGYDVTEAATAQIALEAMEMRPAAIALLDVQMPEHDGMWLAERLRARWARTAIIFATGVSDIPVVKKGRALGAVDYVTKPFDRELLHQALLRAHERPAAQSIAS